MLLYNDLLKKKTLIITRITRPNLAGKSDLVTLVHCGWSGDLDVFCARGNLEKKQNYSQFQKWTIFDNININIDNVPLTRSLKQSTSRSTLFPFKFRT